jgi:hypothetical protein
MKGSYKIVKIRFFIFEGKKIFLVGMYSLTFLIILYIIMCKYEYRDVL